MSLVNYYVPANSLSLLPSLPFKFLISTIHDELKLYYDDNSFFVGKYDIGDDVKAYYEKNTGIPKEEQYHLVCTCVFLISLETMKEIVQASYGRDHGKLCRVFRSISLPFVQYIKDNLPRLRGVYDHPPCSIVRLPLPLSNNMTGWNEFLVPSSDNKPQWAIPIAIVLVLWRSQKQLVLSWLNDNKNVEKHCSNQDVFTKQYGNFYAWWLKCLESYHCNEDGYVAIKHVF